MRSIRALFLVALLAGIASGGLFANDVTIVGTWEMVEIGDASRSFDGDALVEIGRDGETLELTEDGAARRVADGETTESGSYDYDPESGELTLTLTNQDNQEAEYYYVVNAVSENRMVISIPNFITEWYEKRP